MNIIIKGYNEIGIEIYYEKVFIPKVFIPNPDFNIIIKSVKEQHPTVVRVIIDIAL